MGIISAVNAEPSICDLYPVRNANPEDRAEIERSLLTAARCLYEAQVLTDIPPTPENTDWDANHAATAERQSHISNLWEDYQRRLAIISKGGWPLALRGGWCSRCHPAPCRSEPDHWTHDRALLLGDDYSPPIGIGL